MTVVSNSSPLIALARIGQFELLRLLYQELLIPPAVRDEVVRFGEERFGAVELERADWIQTVAVSDRLRRCQRQSHRSGIIARTVRLRRKRSDCFSN